jgi:hypothetical protein
MQGPGGFGRCARRFVEQQIDLRKRRQAFLGSELSHVADQRAATEHRDRDSGEGCRLQSANAVADAGDAPSQARGFQPLDGMVAIDIAGR